MILQAALLGVVQGLTEFLPVSSSAHLILARAFFGWNSDRFGLAFDVACHLGTLVAVVLYFRRELANMVAAIPAMFSTPLPPEARQLWLIAVGTLPIVAAGLLFNDYVERTLRTPAVAAVTLTLGAVGLFAAERIGRGTRTDESLTAMEAAGIGCAQAAALIPGVSRSGATITLAMLFGLRRDTAARFTFLLSIPAIIAAAGKETPDLAAQGLGGDGAVIFVTGMVVSAVVGYLAVKYFIRYLSGHSLDAFAWYRLALAAVTVVWLLGGSQSSVDSRQSTVKNSVVSGSRQSQSAVPVGGAGRLRSGMVHASSGGMNAKSPEELQVYQKAKVAADAVSAILRRPCFRHELRLRGQMGASSERVGSTIVEGFGQSTDRAFAEYLHRSNASTYEIRNQLRVALGRGYVSESECTRISAQYDEIARMNTGLIKHLKREDRRDRQSGSHPPDQKEPPTTDDCD